MIGERGVVMKFVFRCLFCFLRVYVVLFTFNVLFLHVRFCMLGLVAYLFSVWCLHILLLHILRLRFYVYVFTLTLLRLHFFCFCFTFTCLR